MTWTKYIGSSLIFASFLALAPYSFAMMDEVREDSSYKVTSPPNVKSEDLLQAHTAIFREALEEINTNLTQHISQFPSVFICYSRNNDTHVKRVEALALDLKGSGIPLGKLLLDRWANRPGSGTDIFNHADLISDTDKVILIGSPGLKEKYEAQRGIVSQELTSLRTRWNGQKKKEGIIPVWFEGRFADNFPSWLRALPGDSLAKDYFLEFFDLLIDIYQLDPTKNFILEIKKRFEARRQIPSGMALSYGQKLLELKKKEAEENEKEVQKILERSLARQTPPPRNWVAITSEVLPFNLPDRNTCFLESKPLGKEDSYLTFLWKKLSESQSAIISGCSSFKKFTVSGLGGVGKTQLALAYAWEAFDKKAYNTICWFQLNREVDEQANETSLKEQYKNALTKVGTVREGIKEEKIVDKFKEEFPKRAGKSLLVYDDVISRESVQRLVPQTGCHVLYTSRDSLGWREAEKVDLDVFQLDESVRFLLSETGAEDTQDNRTDAQRIAEALGNLPLALEQAAGYIREEQICFAKYLKEFFKREKELLKLRSESSDYQQVVATTWDITLNKLSPLARKLMNYFAYLGSGNIPLDLFFFSDIGSKEDVSKAAQQLTRYSMIKRKEATVSVHQLVQSAVRNKYPPQEQKVNENETMSLLMQFLLEEESNQTTIKAWLESIPLDQRTYREDLIAQAVPLVSQLSVYENKSKIIKILYEIFTEERSSVLDILQMIRPTANNLSEYERVLRVLKSLTPRERESFMHFLHKQHLLPQKDNLTTASLLEKTYKISPDQRESVFSLLRQLYPDFKCLSSPHMLKNFLKVLDELLKIDANDRESTFQTFFPFRLPGGYWDGHEDGNANLLSLFSDVSLDRQAHFAQQISEAFKYLTADPHSRYPIAIKHFFVLLLLKISPPNRQSFLHDMLRLIPVAIDLGYEGWDIVEGIDELTKIHNSSEYSQKLTHITEKLGEIGKQFDPRYLTMSYQIKLLHRKRTGKDIGRLHEIIQKILGGK